VRILPALLLLPALSLAGEPGEQPLGWLIGCWVTPDGSAQEVWVADGDGGLSGFSVSVADNKVSSSETLTIRPDENGALVYTAHPSGQASTSFIAKEATENSALFVNPAHDYPQRIGYTRASDRLQATISLLDGSRPVTFNKVACH
jgi:hypothetical protein